MKTLAPSGNDHPVRVRLFPVWRTEPRFDLVELRGSGGSLREFIAQQFSVRSRDLYAVTPERATDLLDLPLNFFRQEFDLAVSLRPFVLSVALFDPGQAAMLEEASSNDPAPMPRAAPTPLRPSEQAVAELAAAAGLDVDIDRAIPADPGSLLVPLRPGAPVIKLAVRHAMALTAESLDTLNGVRQRIQHLLVAKGPGYDIEAGVGYDVSVDLHLLCPEEREQTAAWCQAGEQLASALPSHRLRIHIVPYRDDAHRLKELCELVKRFKLLADEPGLAAAFQATHLHFGLDYSGHDPEGRPTAFLFDRSASLLAAPEILLHLAAWEGAVLMIERPLPHHSPTDGRGDQPGTGRSAPRRSPRLARRRRTLGPD